MASSYSRMTIHVDDKEVKRRLKRLEKTIAKTGKSTLPQVMRWARDKIILATPKETGDTARAIGITKEVHSKGKDELVLGMKYIPYGSENRPGSWTRNSTNLLDFMMHSTRAVTGFYPYGNKRTGLVTFSKDVKVMRNVPIQAIEKFKKRVKTNFKNI